MAKRITADRDASAAGKKKAKDTAEAAFKKTEPQAAAAPAGETLKATVLELNLPAKRDYALHLKTRLGLLKKKDEIVALLRNARKREKEVGIDPMHIDEAIKWQGRDPLEFKTFLAGVLRACEVAGMETPQLSFFDESGLSPEEKALQDGHRAGLAGQSYGANPHDLNSDIGRKWEEGRMRGQADLVGEQFSPPTEETKAETASDGDADKGPWPDDEQVEAQRQPTRLDEIAKGGEQAAAKEPELVEEAA